MYELLITLNDVLNKASFACGLLVVLIILGCMCVSCSSMNRRSIRFTLAISVVDVLKAGVLLVYNEVNEDGVVCEGISFAFHYLTLVYLFLNVAVALNLQLVFVHGVIVEKKHEAIYWYVCLGLPYALLLFPLTAGKIGLDNAYCEFRDPTTLETNLYVYFCFLLWCILSCLYCAVAVIMVIVQLRQKVTVLDYILKRTMTQSAKESSDLKRKIEKLIYRISLYCIIPVVTQVGYIMLRVIASYDPSPYLPLLYISIVGSDIPGMLNLLVLLLDPAFSSAVESILKKKGLKLPRIFVSSSDGNVIQSDITPEERFHENTVMKPLVYPYPCLCTATSSGNVYQMANDTRSLVALKGAPSSDSENFAIYNTVSLLGSVIEEATANVTMASAKESQKYALKASEFISYI